jgi:hypothetical protein
MICSLVLEILILFRRIGYSVLYIKLVYFLKHDTKFPIDFSKTLHSVNLRLPTEAAVLAEIVRDKTQGPGIVKLCFFLLKHIRKRCFCFWFYTQYPAFTVIVNCSAFPFTSRQPETPRLTSLFLTHAGQHSVAKQNSCSRNRFHASRSDSSKLKIPPLTFLKDPLSRVHTRSYL